MGNGKIESIIFDFDGTLAELHLDFAEMKHRLGALAQGYLDARLPLPTQPVLEWLDTLRSSIKKTSDQAAEEFQERAGALIVNMELEAADHGALFPYTRPILTTLAAKRVKIAIITRNCERAVKRVFPDMDDYCSAFLAREHVPRVKPDPDHLLRALKKLVTSPDTALMVGDHPLDIQTGKNAGTLTAGVSSGKSSQADLSNSGADWTARDCEELMDLLIGESML